MPMKAKICIVYSTPNDQNWCDNYSQEIISKSGLKPENIVVFPIINKREYSLSQAYNLGFRKFDEMIEENEYDDQEWIVCFCHHDIKFRSQNWGNIIFKTFNKYPDFGIIGVAGTDHLFPHMCWWLNQEGKNMSKYMSGRVWHFNGLREYESIYSEKINGIKEVVVVDGVCMFVDPCNIVEEFDETIPDYHFYDICLCLNNKLNDSELKIGVIDTISILHNSIGETNDMWEQCRQLAIRKYGQYLPIEIK